MAQEIPDKLYFKIGEVARIVGVKPHVLRYWESEFDCLNPGKSRSQQRLFRRQDIETILQIKDLLHSRGFTIAGARKALQTQKRSRSTRNVAMPAAPENRTTATKARLLREIRSDLLRLRDSLASEPRR